MLPKISIAITNYNSTSRTIKCLEQFLSINYPINLLDIVVLDNASNDGKLNELENTINELRLANYLIKFHIFNSHPGVTNSYNFALNLFDNDSLFLIRLDNDVEVESDLFKKVIEYMLNDNAVGVCGPKIMYSFDKRRLNSGAILINKLGFKNLNFDSIEPYNCDSLLGAIMFFRKDAILKIGYWFNPDFYLFAEEPDICFKLKRNGYKVIYLPIGNAYHDTGISTGKHSFLSEYLNFRNHTLLYNREFSKLSSIFRNFHLLVRTIFYILFKFNTIPFIGFMDGLRNKKISLYWWNTMLKNPNKFSRP